MAEVGGYGLLTLVAACIPAYWSVFVETHRSPAGSYAIDIGEVRRLADTQSGEKPLVVRLETVEHLSAPKVFVVAGDGPVFGAQSSLPRRSAKSRQTLPNQGASDVLAIASAAGLQRSPAYGPLVPYGASKAGMNYYTRALAKELAASNKIRLNIVTPGGVETPGDDIIRNEMLTC